MLKIFYEATDCVYVCYNEKCKSWDMLGQHYHNTYEMYLLTEGERKVYVNGQRYLLKPWELLIIEPYILHYFQKGTEYISRYVMNIPPEILNGFLDKKEIEYLLKGIPSCVIPLEGEMRDDIKRYFVRTKSYNYRTTPLAGKLMVCYMVQFLDYINVLAEKASTVFNSESLIVRPDMLEAITFIHNHYMDEKFGLDDVTEHIHMSKSRFCELFRQTTGQTFLKYLNRIRVMPVEKELWSTNKSLSRLAEENGFSSVAHMTRVFRAAYGKAPSEYRKEEKRKKGIFER